MDKDGKLKLSLVDVYGNPLGEKVDVTLRNQTLTDNKTFSVKAAKKILIQDLYGAPQGLYRIEIDPSAYLPVSQFVSLKASGITDLSITFPVDSNKVRKVNFPSFGDLPSDLQRLLNDSDAVFSFEQKTGATLYEALDDIRRAGLLNIFKKAANTLLVNGRTVFTYVQKLVELRGDRFFVIVPKELREETKNSAADGRFSSVSEALHHPPAGYSPAGSYKTLDRYGNLQLSFFMKDDACVADIDIDDAAGIEHVFQVLKNALTGRPTHPYAIHEILIQYQKLDPGYSFVLSDV
jgi:hypothetical protein